MTTQKTSRLGRRDWLAAGIQALADAGPTALRAEVLARRIGTTKGSFYWHFTDLPAFHLALLKHWEALALSELVEALLDESSDVGRLRLFGQLIASKSGRADSALSVEPAIRAWAIGHGDAARTVARVDAKRLSYLRDLLADIGIANAEMARLIYAASIGMEALSAGDPLENARSMGSLVDLILALR